MRNKTLATGATLVTTAVFSLAIAAEMSGQAIAATANSQPDGDATSLFEPYETLDEGIVWTPRVDCAECHEQEVKSEEDENCIAASHAGLDCSYCHTDEKGLIEAHETCFGLLAKMQTFTVVENATCLACHDAEKLAEATAGLTVLKDKADRVANPHDLPANADHETLTCHE